ncbi:Uncharacterised protein [Enterobacter cloacae]|nr:Uncharacterised protein [Enterobacter cloacae]
MISQKQILPSRKSQNLLKANQNRHNTNQKCIRKNHLLNILLISSQAAMKVFRTRFTTPPTASAQPR